MDYHVSRFITYKIRSEAIDTDDSIVRVYLDMCVDQETAKFIVGLNKFEPVFEQIMNYMIIKNTMEE